MPRQEAEDQHSGAERGDIPALSVSVPSELVQGIECREPKGHAICQLLVGEPPGSGHETQQADIGQWILLGLVLRHIAAILFDRYRKHDLVSAMLHGDKELVLAAPASRDDTMSRTAALILFMLCAGLAYWVSTLETAAF